MSSKFHLLFGATENTVMVMFTVDCSLFELDYLLVFIKKKDFY